MLKKASLYVLFALLALVLTAVIALYLVVKLALAPGPDEWPARIQVGPVAIDVGVPTALRLATSTWAGPWLDGHGFDSRWGPVVLGWDEPSATLEARCAPCSATLPDFGQTPIRLDSLRGTVHRDAGTLSGVIEATPAARASGGAHPNVLHARWTGRLTQSALRAEIHASDAPIVDWYAALAPGLPELQRAHIDGTLALDAQLNLPAATFSVQPRFSQFAVDGLGTEALVGTRSACGPSARLGAESTLARAVIAAEDPSFLSHPGYEASALTAALGLNPKAGSAERAGSTLDERLGRLLSPSVANLGDPGIERLRALLYAVELEQTLGKARILQAYLDNAPWGPNLCGAEAAARTYFKRGARNVDAVQAVWLAVLVQDPTNALAQWKRDGKVDGARAKAVADAMKGLTKVQRDGLVQGLEAARFAPP